MCKICPKCGAIAEYSAYYGRTICTRCSWESEKKEKKIFKPINRNFGTVLKQVETT